ncbi:MAG: transcription antitermination factor NusB [Coriobacteriia bacterium]|nr:transcription antitermination factor NusB [Coriobacteriia bacterium]
MMLERSRARRQALHILYQREITGEDTTAILDVGSYSAEDGEPLGFCRELLVGVEEHLGDIDERLGRISEHWTVARMPLVDRNILRLASYEILFVDDIPASVSINEAVEMAKVYGGDDSSKFVNGVLGKLAEEVEPGKGGSNHEDG